MAKKPPCECEALPAAGDEESDIRGPFFAEGKKVRRKYLKNVGKGKFCVFSKKSGDLVRCYEKKKSAQRVARGFGTSFAVKKRR